MEPPIGTLVTERLEEGKLASAFRHQCIVVEPPPGTPLLSLEADPLLALGGAGTGATLIEKPTAEHPRVGWRMADGSKIRITETFICIWLPYAEAAAAAAQRVLLEGWKTVLIRGPEEGRLMTAMMFRRHDIEEEDVDLRARAIAEEQRQRQAARTRQEAARRAEERRKEAEAREAARIAEDARLAAEAEEDRKQAALRSAEQARQHAVVTPETAPATASPVTPDTAPKLKKRFLPGRAM